MLFLLPCVCVCLFLPLGLGSDSHTQYHLDTLRLLSAEQVSAQIARAHAAQRGWARTSFAQRQSFMRSLKAWVVRDMEGIVAVACRDTGKTRESGRGVVW